MHAEVVNHRYQLRDTVGKGGMGIVYRANDRLTGETVALKQVTIPVQQLEFASRATVGNRPATQEIKLALTQEFRTLASLRHPNIISVLDYGFSNDRTGNPQPYYTMQLIQGAQPIDTYAATLSPVEKVGLIREALNALAYLHRRGIIHRDLSPGNILVTPEGRVKIMDFGLAIQQSTAQESAAEGVAGTVAYMAPEIFSGEPPSNASDLYAIGMIMYQLLTGQYPFPNKNLASLISAIVFSTIDFSQVPDPFKLVVEKLLAKQPYERFASAEDVIRALIEALDEPIPMEDMALRESFLQAARFVGRSSEFAQLTASLHSISQPPSATPEIKAGGQGWLVAGESGVGKSRLLEELRAHAMVEGAMVLRGQAVAEGGLPYQLWRDVVRRLILSTSLSDLEAGILKEIVPDIGILLGREIADAPTLEGTPRQQRLVAAIGDLFKRQTQPVVLILEDLQWAEESLTVLQHLLIFLEDYRWLLIGSYRDDEKPDLPSQLAEMQVLKLARLEQAAIAELSESMLGAGGGNPQIVALLERESEGNAFFMVEVVRALAERAGSLANVTDMTLPRSIFAGGVQAIVQRRLAQVPSDLRAWLKLAAVAGRQIDLKVMRAAHPTGDMEIWLDTFANAAVLEAIEGEWRFSHDKIREALLIDLTPDEKIALNRQIAEAIETTYPDDTSRAVVLMEHWHTAHDAHKEADYARIAAYQLALTGHNREALGIVERGLALPINDPMRLQFIKLKADAFGNLGQTAEAEKYNLETLTMAEAANDPIMTVDALRGLGRSMTIFGRYTEAIQLHERALAIAREHAYTVGIAINLIHLARTLSLLGQHEVARAHLETAEGLMQQLNDLRGLVNVYSNLGVVVGRMNDVQGSLVLLEKALQFSRELGDHPAEAVILQDYGATLCWKLHDIKGGEKYLLEAIALLQAIGIMEHIGNGFNNLGIIYAMGGDMARGRGYFAEAVRNARRVNQPLYLCNYLGNLSQACYSLGDFNAAHAAAQEAVTIFEQVETVLPMMLTCYVQLAFAEIALGMFDSAYPHMKSSIRVCREHKVTIYVLETLVAFAEWHIGQQRRLQGAELLGLVSAHPDFNDDLASLRVGPAREKLNAVLSPDEIAAALERGKALDFETVVQGILAGQA